MFENTKMFKNIKRELEYKKLLTAIINEIPV